MLEDNCFPLGAMYWINPNYNQQQIDEDMKKIKQNLDYYSNIYHDISSGHIGYFLKWMIDNLDMRCHDGIHKYLTDKILFATDYRYGRKKVHDRVFELIKFWELFFKIAGGFHHWGEKEEIEKMLNGNARQIMKRLGVCEKLSF